MCDAELTIADSIAAIKRSIAQAAAGELQSAEVFFDWLERTYETNDSQSTDDAMAEV